jgi:diamine N-acetyltransferase
MESIEIVRVLETDLATLRRISIMTFRETFSDVNTKENMDLYISASFNEQKTAKELKDPASGFYFCTHSSNVIGYMKVNFGEAQTEFKDPAALEIERIYIAKVYQGRGAGAALIRHAEEIAKKRNLKYLWLGVWEHNRNAIQFYERSGFKAAGSHQFMLGNDPQLDIIMKKYF